MSAQTLTAMRSHEKYLDLFILLCIIAVVWQGLYGYVGDSGMSSPFATFVNAWLMLGDGDFWSNVHNTFTALGLALAIEVGAGLVIGLTLGLNRLAGEIMEPIIVGFYSVPKVVFYPVILMFFGINMAAEVAFGVIHGILPIMLFTMHAVRNIKPVFLKTARTFRLTRTQKMLYVAMPAAVPEIFTGLRFGFATTLIGVLLSEMFGAKNGLGYMMMNAIGYNKVDRIMALTLVFASFAVVVNVALLVIDHRLHRRV